MARWPVGPCRRGASPGVIGLRYNGERRTSLAAHYYSPPTPMIRGVHTMFYSTAADELRRFFRDQLNFPAVDVGDGWLIFDVAEADLGVHPTDASGQNPPNGTHNISFYTDDVHASVAALKANGVEFTQDVQNFGYGLVTQFRAPGGLEIQLYQPLYEKRFVTNAKPAAKRRPAAKSKAAAAKSKAAAPKSKPSSKVKAKATVKASSKAKAKATRQRATAKRRK